MATDSIPPGRAPERADFLEAALAELAGSLAAMLGQDAAMAILDQVADEVVGGHLDDNAVASAERIKLAELPDAMQAVLNTLGAEFERDRASEGGISFVAKRDLVGPGHGALIAFARSLLGQLAAGSQGFASVDVTEAEGDADAVYTVHFEEKQPGRVFRA
ncbi:MAG: hypothetical protein AAF871_03235 [Pseudomonadota bacterium]